METDAQPAVPGEPIPWILRFTAQVVEHILWVFAMLPLIVGIGIWAEDEGPFALVIVGFLLSAAAAVFLAAQYRDGRSVGKRAMGIRVVHADGAPPSWAYNFIVRTLLIKWLLISLASAFTFGIVALINYLWPLWDGKRQALHDKVVGTFVVRAPGEELGWVTIRRFFAAILDLIVMVIIFVILGIAGVVEAADPEEDFNVVSSVVSAIIVLIYYVGLTATLGQTLGKMALGIKVVNVDGEKPGFGAVLTREVIVRVLGTVLAVVLGPVIDPGLGSAIGGVVALIAIIWLLFDSRRQGLHDRVAKTFIVKTPG